MLSNPSAGPLLTRLRSVLTTAALLTAIWWTLDGPDGLVWGLPAAVVAAAMGRWLAPARSAGLRLVALPGFMLFFVVESLRGGFDVAWRAFHPKLPLQPERASQALRLPAGAPRTLLVSCVSLLPGTLSADFDAEANRLEVHSLAGDPGPALRVLERRIGRLFGLELGAEA